MSHALLTSFEAPPPRPLPEAVVATELDAIADRCFTVLNALDELHALPELERLWIQQQLALIAARVQTAADGLDFRRVPPPLQADLPIEPFRLVAPSGGRLS